MMNPSKANVSVQMMPQRPSRSSLRCYALPKAPLPGTGQRPWHGGDGASHGR